MGRALKEALLWSPGFATTARRATVLRAGEVGAAAARTLAAAPGPPAPVAAPGEYLLDPNPAVTRAGWSPNSPAISAAGRSIR